MWTVLNKIKEKRQQERIKVIRISVHLIRRMKEEEIIEEMLEYPEYIQECLTSFKTRYQEEIRELSKSLKGLSWTFSNGMVFNGNESAIRFFVLMLIMGEEPESFFKNIDEFLKGLRAEGFFELACYLEYGHIKTMNDAFFEDLVLSKYWDTYPCR